MEQAAVAGRPDQHRPAGIDVDQRHAAQDQRAHDALAQLGLGHQQRAQRFGRHHQHLDGADGLAVAQRRPARQLRHLAAELAGAVLGDRRGVAQAVVAADRDAPLQHQHQAEAGHAGLEQRLAVLEMAHVAEAQHALDVSRRQHRKHLVAARVAGQFGRGHVDRVVLAIVGYEFQRGRGHGESGVRGSEGLRMKLLKQYEVYRMRAPVPKNSALNITFVTAGRRLLHWPFFVRMENVAMSASTTIRPVGSADLPAFFAYLNAHLQDNGRDGAPLFQPMPRAQSLFPEEKIAAFSNGLALAVGAPGWRRAWIASGEGGIAGHVDLRARPDGHAAHRALLEAAQDWAALQPGLDWIDLEVLSANAAALRLYRGGGFVQTGEIADMFRVDGERLGYLFMTRPLHTLILNSD